MAERDTASPWKSPKQGADYAGVPERTFRKWLRCGLPSFRIGVRIRVNVGDIDEFIRSRPTRTKAGKAVDSTGRAMTQPSNAPKFTSKPRIETHGAAQ